MKRILTLVVTLCLALGAMVAPAQVNPPQNPFAGSWFGTWVNGEDGQDGTLDLTISNTGRITGRITHTQDGADGDGAMVGQVRADGRLILIGYVPADNYLHGNGIPQMGTAVIDGDTLAASFTATYSGGFSVVAIFERY